MFSAPHCNRSTFVKNIDHKAKSTNNEEQFLYFLKKSISKTRYIFVDSNRYGIVWRKVIIAILLHLVYFGAVVHLVINRVYGPWIFSFIYGYFSAIGITVGAHRLWSHRSFKAKLPLRIALMIMQTMAGQLDIFSWVQIHRVHHKFADTDADPHNSKRGFFFAHIGWLLTTEHPDVHLKQETVDYSDLVKDPVIRFQKKYYIILYPLFCFLLPTILSRYLFGGSWIDSFFVGSFGRYIVSIHAAAFVNSAAHMFGDRPYNPNIASRENTFVAIGAWGSEGFHNYHHVFPWDYTISEMGWKFNPMKSFIDLMAKCGQAYDLRRPSNDLIQKTKENATQSMAPIDPYKSPHIYY